ncbi:hypothetical protein HAX54_026408 [Datura stramonium]|uniref:Uncharacterized protein n=1 Tax=Datura stramonium TaxID=4076 RepID=A0ABS8S7S8_DATST|nr:hypothetical protein [Datura stramonium]
MKGTKWVPGTKATDSNIIGTRYARMVMGSRRNKMVVTNKPLDEPGALAKKSKGKLVIEESSKGKRIVSKETGREPEERPDVEK